MRDNQGAYHDTVTLEVEERPRPQKAPGVQIIRDPLAPESMARRFWKGVLVGALGAVVIVAAVVFLLRDGSTDRAETLAGPAPAVAPGAVASVPRVDATVSVRTIPAGAEILVDAEPAGRTPMLDRSLGTGTHMFSIRMDGYATVDTLVTVRAGETHDLVLALGAGRRSQRASSSAEPLQTQSPTARTAALQDDSAASDNQSAATSSPSDEPQTAASSSTPARASITIRSEPAGAVVTSGGRSLGRTPLSDVRLEEGTHVLRFSLADHQTVDQSVVVGSGSEVVSVTMAPEVGRLRVLALPWGSIYVDGQLRHQDTDLRHVLELPAGNHVIRAEHPILGSIERSVRVIGGETTDLVLNLNQ